MVCKKCGTHLGDDYAYCTNCGEPVGGTEAHNEIKQVSTVLPVIIGIVCAVGCFISLVMFFVNCYYNYSAPIYDPYSYNNCTEPYMYDGMEILHKGHDSLGVSITITDLSVNPDNTVRASVKVDNKSGEDIVISWGSFLISSKEDELIGETLYDAKDMTKDVELSKIRSGNEREYIVDFDGNASLTDGVLKFYYSQEGTDVDNIISVPYGLSKSGNSSTI